MKKWKINSWRNYPVKHIPKYDDEKDLNLVLDKIKSFPPLVFAGETTHLKGQPVPNQTYNLNKLLDHPSNLLRNYRSKLAINLLRNYRSQ